MSVKSHLRQVPSLINICTYYVTSNLTTLKGDIELISNLPEYLKDKILRFFTVNISFRKDVNFNQIMKALANPRTKQIDLTSYAVDDEVLKIIEICSNLRNLYLTSILHHNMTSEGLISLFPNLNKLYLLRLSDCSAVNDDVIVCISKHCPSLAGLDVGGCESITSRSLDALKNLRNLLWLTLSKTQVCNDGLESLLTGPSGSKLKELRIAGCPKLNDFTLKIIADNCTELEILVFYNCNKVEDHTYFAFAQSSLKNLKQLEWTIQW